MMRFTDRDVPVSMRQQINCDIIHLDEADGHIEREAEKEIRRDVDYSKLPANH